MSNPFDKNFFKFFMGFTLILFASFGMLYFIGIYTNVGAKQAAVISPVP